MRLQRQTRKETDKESDRQRSQRSIYQPSTQVQMPHRWRILRFGNSVIQMRRHAPVLLNRRMVSIQSQVSSGSFWVYSNGTNWKKSFPVFTLQCLHSRRRYPVRPAMTNHSNFHGYLSCLKFSSYNPFNVLTPTLKLNDFEGDVMFKHYFGPPTTSCDKWGSVYCKRYWEDQVSNLGI